MTRTLDPLTLSLIWNRLIATVEEQAQTLIRTAFSATVREAGDLSAGVFDRAGRMVAQAVTGTPGHVNAMAASVGAFLRAFPEAALRDGDVLVTNDPWDGTGHLNDFTVVTPVFRNGRMIAYFAATSHIADVGGLGFGPDGRDIYEEGLQVPICRLFTARGPDETLLKLIKANVRDPAAAEGDLYSLAASNAAGARRLADTLDDFGLADIEATAEAIILQSRAAMAAAIGALPDGSWRYEMEIDGYDDPVRLVCTATIDGDLLDLSFDGTSGASRRGVNVPLTYAQAYAAYGARVLIGPETPNNAGSLGAVRVTAPAGSILNAVRPAPVSSRHVVGQMLPDVVLGALAGAAPGRTPAEGASCLYLPVLRSAPGDPDPFVLNPFLTGGTGARAGKDGLSCTAFPSGVRATPVEIAEADAPVIVRRKEFRIDSGGAGARRGGLGQTIEYEHRFGREMMAAKMFDRIIRPARGRDGGGPGGAGGVRLARAGTLPGMGLDPTPAGERLVIDTPGGGGAGDPGGRAPAALADDLRKGFVSLRAAREIYGVETSVTDGEI